MGLGDSKLEDMHMEMRPGMMQPLIVRYANHSHAKQRHEAGSTLKGILKSWSAPHGLGLVSVDSGGPDVHLSSNACGFQQADGIREN